MDLPDFAFSDYFNYLNHEKELLLLESTNSLNNMRDYLERNVFCNEIGGSFQDIIDSLSPENMLNYSTCRPKAKRINKMLNELAKYSYRDNLTLEELLNFANFILTLNTTQGIILPFSLIPNENNELNDSTEGEAGDFAQTNPDTSFSYLEGTEQEKTECYSCWMKIADKVTELTKDFLSTFPNPTSIEKNEQFGKLIEILQLFNAPITSWKIYKESRQKAFGQATINMTKWMAKLDDLDGMVNSWEKYCDTVIESLEIDCQFIVVLFAGINNAQDAILNNYLDSTIEEVKIFLDRLRSRLGQLSTSSPKLKQKPGQKSAHFDNSKLDISNSFSKIMISSSNLKPQVNHYLNNPNNFKSICSIISCFARMENRIDSLLNSHWATPLGVNIDSSWSTKKPKGVLKNIRRPSRRLSNEVSEYRILEKVSTEPTTSPVFEENVPTYIPCLEWQTMMKSMFPTLSTAFEYHLMVLFEKIQLEENPQQFFLEPINQPSPAKVSESLQDYLRFIEEILPIIMVCYDSPVESLLTTFHGCIKTQISKLYNDLQIVASTRQTLDILFLTLSNSIALQLVWSLLNNLFKPKSEELSVYFFEQKKLFSDFQKMFCRQLVERCFNELVSVILQDSKSNFWSDLKEFHENTRVGYPIQVWHLYLQRLWYLLSSTCPVQVAREILGDVLMRSLEFLVQRYASAKPSRRRLNQVRADMIAIFHIVEFFIFNLADNVDDLLGFGEDLSKMKRIHFASMSLLQIVLILTGPIDLLSSIHGQGFNKGLKQPLKDYSNSFWMHMIKPKKYQNSLPNCDGMKSVDSTLSGIIALQLFMNSPQFEKNKIIEFVCHDKMSLMTKIMTYLSKQLVYNQAQYNQICSIFLSFYQVILVISDPFNYFHSVITKIIDSNQGWSEFHCENDCLPPVWLSALYDICDPYVTTILNNITSFINDQSKPNLDLNSKLFPDGLLPCGCEYTKINTATEKEEEKHNFLKEITGQICTQALHLPMSMQTSMAKMQIQLEERNISVLGNHCILHMLLQTIRRKLIKLNEDAHAYWIEIASFLEESEVIHSRREMVINIVNKRLDDLDMNPFQEIEENRSTKSFFLGVQYNHIASTPTGLEDLKNIDKFIRLNGDKILSLIESKTECKFDFDIDTSQTLTSFTDGGFFNPIEKFCKIGNDDFDHRRFFNLVIDWNNLCSNDIGLTEISVETILSHRWELDVVNKNEESDLTDDTVKATKVLIDKYGLTGDTE